jgi:pilus assembly protein CpaB
MIAGTASYTVYRLASSRQNTAKAAPPVQVVVAARDLEIGTLVREADLKMADWAGPLPKGWTTKASAVNRGVASSIYQGEPITENRLAPAGSGGGLAATIPAGMRACAIRVNEVVGVAGFVIPGMRVDVLITGVPPGDSSGAGPAVKTLLQNIEVLSAGANIEKDKEGKPQQVQVVNLLVDPHQAEILSLAGNETRIQLILRNPTDTVVTKPPGTTMADLFDAPKIQTAARAAGPAPMPDPSPRAVQPAPSFDTIEVVNGPTHTLAKFRSAEQNQ